MTRDEARSIFIWYAKHFIGKPYIWGGDDPVLGFDCSGYVLMCLQGIGKLPRNIDLTAHGLWMRYAPERVLTPHEGCLVFWSDDGGKSIRHIEICLNDELSLGASGGGSKTKTTDDAIRQNAFIKIQPIIGRGMIAGYVDPFLG